MPGKVWTAIIVAAFLATFAVVAMTASAEKSPTYDEPMHLVGAYVHRLAHDYRIDEDHPPLLGLIATLPLTRATIRLNLADPDYESAITDVTAQWNFAAHTMFGRANDATSLMGRVRPAFVGVAVLLGALIGLSAWKLAGPWAAVASVALFALDPNFLAHSPIIKNDVLLALVLLALTFVTWQAGVRATWYWLLAVAVGVGLAMNAKFTGVLAMPIIALALAMRALMSRPWNVLGFELRSRAARFATLAPILLGVAVVAWAMTWAFYGFRFAATSDGRLLDTAQLIQDGRVRLAEISTVIEPTDQEIAATPLDFTMRLTVWMQQAHLLPQAWIYGFLYTYVSALSGRTFLCGEISNTWLPTYLPLAMLFKTPLATLAAIATAIGLFATYTIRRLMLGRRGPSLVGGGIWTILAWSLTPVVYAAAAMSSNHTLGLRHTLPIYPFLFIAVGVATAATIRRKPPMGIGVLCVIVLGLAAETAWQYPNYLAFFNEAAGGPRGGFKLLGDSNLDWGQDLPALAAWQRANPRVPLYLSYFGTADPGYYGIRAFPVERLLPGPVAYPLRGVLAISATNLQGVGPAGSFAEALQLHGPPRDVLNGTIYLYDVP